MATSAQPPTSTPREKTQGMATGDAAAASRGSKAPTRPRTRPMRGDKDNLPHKGGVDRGHGTAAFQAPSVSNSNRARAAKSPVATPRGSVRSEGAGSATSSKRPSKRPAHTRNDRSDRETPALQNAHHQKASGQSSAAAVAPAQGPIARRRQVTSSEASGRGGGGSGSGFRGATALQRKSLVSQRLEPSVLHEHYNDSADKMDAMLSLIHI